MNNQATGAGSDPRIELCRKLSLGGPIAVHQMIVDGTKKGVSTLLQKGLTSKNLLQLGYSIAAMRKLGYDDNALRLLGYGVEVPDEPEPRKELNRPDGPAQNDEPNLRNLIAAGCRASELKTHGWTVHHCKRAGCSTGELVQLGYTLAELTAVCTIMELKREGFGPRELSKFFSKSELVKAGFSAADMRLAGFGVRELLNMGYNENHVRTAGFSTSDLISEGLTKVTRTSRH